MTATILENIGSVRASLEELDAGHDVTPRAGVGVED